MDALLEGESILSMLKAGRIEKKVRERQISSPRNVIQPAEKTRPLSIKIDPRIITLPQSSSKLKQTIVLPRINSQREPVYSLIANSKECAPAKDTEDDDELSLHAWDNKFDT